MVACGMSSPLVHCSDGLTWHVDQSGRFGYLCCKDSEDPYRLAMLISPRFLSTRPTSALTTQVIEPASSGLRDRKVVSGELRPRCSAARAGTLRNHTSRTRSSRLAWDAATLRNAYIHSSTDTNRSAWSQPWRSRSWGRSALTSVQPRAHR